MTHDQITNLFTGFRESIDREKLDARRTGAASPRRSQRSATG